MCLRVKFHTLRSTWALSDLNIRLLITLRLIRISLDLAEEEMGDHKSETRGILQEWVAFFFALNLY